MSIRANHLILCLSLALPSAIAMPSFAAESKSTDVSAATPSTTEDTVEERFEKAYAAYLEKDNRYSRGKLAWEAYELGRQVYGDDHINTANLILNVLTHNTYSGGEGQRERRQLATQALSIYEAEYEPTDLQMLDVLLANMSSHNSERVNEGLGRRLMELADHYESSDPLLANQVRFEAGKELLAAGSPRSSIILAARNYFAEHLAPDDPLYANSTFYSARYYVAAGRRADAIDAFEETIELVEGTEGATPKVELYARAQLVALLEQTGDSETATKHCIEIGALQPEKGNQDAQPLFRMNPEYPLRLFRAGHEAQVRLRFDVTENGFVDNIDIISNSGHAGFEKVARQSLSSWRYAPEFKDGKPVRSSGRTVQLDFNVN